MQNCVHSSSRRVPPDSWFAFKWIPHFFELAKKLTDKVSRFRYTKIPQSQVSYVHLTLSSAGNEEGSSYPPQSPLT